MHKIIQAAVIRGDYETALKTLMTLAEQGDADAQKNLGVIYSNGEGVAQDYAEAVRWFRLAAEQGNALGQFYLGWMYYSGEGGVTQDYAEAVMFKSKYPSNTITGLEFSAEVLLIMQSGKILMTSASLAAKEKNHLDGAVFEIMVKMLEGDPFFVYYKCDEYYQLVQQPVSISDSLKGPEWRTRVSEKIVVFLAKYISYSLKVNIRSLMVSYHHNAKHTNVIAYIEKLDEWYPIRHDDSESDDITELRVYDVNRGVADVSQFVAISGLS